MKNKKLQQQCIAKAALDLRKQWSKKKLTKRNN